MFLAGGGILAVAAASVPAFGWVILGFDALILLAVLLDGLLAPGAKTLRATRKMREPLSAFAPNRIEVTLTNVGEKPSRLQLADAPPASFESHGHRADLRVASGETVKVAYEVVPRSRGEASFGDLFLRSTGPLGLAAQPVRIPASQVVRVYPDLRGFGHVSGAVAPEPGRKRLRGHFEGREFEALRPYLPGDDLRSMDWKATARRGFPIVRDWQPERNQTVWLLLDLGRHLSARLRDGRTKLDHAVDASLALARAATSRGDRAGAVIFGAEVQKVVPPGSGRGQLGPLADALYGVSSRVEESDYGAAFDTLTERQRRRALVVLFTDLADPETSAILLQRAASLRRRHLVLVAAVEDSEVVEVARARPSSAEEAYMRVAAERILAEREASALRLLAAGVRVASVPAKGLVAAVVGQYLDVKGRGEL